MEAGGKRLGTGGSEAGDCGLWPSAEIGVTGRTRRCNNSNKQRPSDEKSQRFRSASALHCERPMSKKFTYRDLDAWKCGMGLVEHCYRVTAAFPKSEQYGITAQMRRAAFSIPSNLAEGHCRRSTKAYANHVSIALGSHGELETCIEAGFRLGFLSSAEKAAFLTVSDPVGRLLNGLYHSLERKLTSPQPPVPSHQPPVPSP